MAVSQIAGAVVGKLRNAGVLQPVPGLFKGLSFFCPGAFVTAQRRPESVAGAHVATHHDVLQHRHLVKQTHVLEGTGDARGGYLLDLSREVGLIGDGELTAVSGIQAGDQVKAGGFARAVGSNQAVDLALVNRQRDVIHGGKAAKAFGHIAHG